MADIQNSIPRLATRVLPYYIRCSEIFTALLTDALNRLMNKVKDCPKSTDGVELMSLQGNIYIRKVTMVFVSKAKGRGLHSYISDIKISKL